MKPLLFKPYRPNPFRSIAHQLQTWLFPLFYWHNDWHLYTKFKLEPLIYSEHTLKHLRNASQAKGGHLIVCNHVCFMDPHVIVETTRRGMGQMGISMAGNDVFEGLYGFQAWYMSITGVFSLDRGSLDRRSMMMAEAVLAKHKEPLVIYAEGEADYSNQTLRPFYSGAFTFALNHATKQGKQASSDAVTWITPIAIRYQFVESPEAEINTAIAALSEELDSLQPDLANRSISKSASYEEKIRSLALKGIAILEQEFLLSPQADLPLEERLTQCREAILISLCKEHCPEALENISELTFQDIMALKNKIRSILAKKYDAPDRIELEKALEILPKSTIKDIKKLENQWLGMAISRFYRADSLEKRRQRLEDHLNSILPWSKIRENASPEARLRWKKQMNQTRQVKLLWLLEEDLVKLESNPSPHWEELDEALVKLEILLFSRFVYRARRRAFVSVGEPIDVQAFLKTNIDLGKRERLNQLTEDTHTSVKSLLDGLYEPETATAADCVLA